jgi:hypothetical protein
VPLGYEVHERKLIVHDGEADLVRHIFQRYLELSSVVALADELNAAGHRTKLQSRSSEPHRGGCLFRRGTLYHLLSTLTFAALLASAAAELDGPKGGARLRLSRSQLDAATLTDPQ